MVQHRQLARDLQGIFIVWLAVFGTRWQLDWDQIASEYPQAMRTFLCSGIACAPELRSSPFRPSFRLLNDQSIVTASWGLLGAVSSWNGEGVWGISSAQNQFIALPQWDS